MSSVYGHDLVAGLKEDEKQALTELESLLADEIEDKARYDAAYLWRFLKARDFKPVAAAEMFREAMRWRAESRVAERCGADYFEFCDADETKSIRELLRKHVPMTIHGIDKNGCPIYVERMGSIDVEGLLQVANEQQIREHHIYYIEEIERRKDALAAERGDGQRFLKHVVIEDLSNLGWAHFNTTWLGIGKRIIAVDEGYYPEITAKLFVINAPWIFTALWNIIKPWLAARTIAKIEICGAKYKEALLVEIDEDQLPREFGGTCKCGAGGSAAACLQSGAKFPESAYRRNLPHDKGSDPTTVVVGSRSKHEVTLKVDVDNTQIAYEFWTDANDISFGVEFAAQTESGAAAGVRMTVQPITRYDAHKEHVHGSFVAPHAGFYVLVFDNSYSYMTKKTLTYKVLKESTEEIK